MFKCGISGKQSEPKEKGVKVVMESRPKKYLDENGEIIGEGWEIVSEKLVLRAVAEEM